MIQTSLFDPFAMNFWCQRLLTGFTVQQISLRELSEFAIHNGIISLNFGQYKATHLSSEAIRNRPKSGQFLASRYTCLSRRLDGDRAKRHAYWGWLARAHGMCTARAIDGIQRKYPAPLIQITRLPPTGFNNCIASSGWTWGMICVA